MITNIVLENFKCFRKVRVRPRLITVFVGPNGSGKSSVLQALALLKQSAKRRELQITGGPLALSSVDDIVPKFLSAPGLVHIEFGGTHAYSTETQFDVHPKVTFNYGANFLKSELTSRSASLLFGIKGQQYEIKAEGADLPNERYRFGQYQLILSLEESIATVARISSWAGGGPEPQVRALLEEIIDTPNSVLQMARFIPAIRGLARPQYQLGPQMSNDVSSRNGLSEQEQQTATNLGYSRPIESKVSDWLRKVTRIGLRADIVPSQTVEVQALTPFGDINFVAEGFGTNSLILLFWQLASASKGATVMIEEPEIHLHPRAQAELVSVLAEVAKDEDKQLIVATHSEHILGRLLTLVAEHKLSADDLAIYAFEKDEQGECTANELEVTEDDRVKGGIKDFFESDLEELERYIRALQPSE